MIQLPVKTLGKPLWIATFALLAAVGLLLKSALALSSFTPSTQPVGYVAQDDLTSYDLRSGGEYVFRGQYEKDSWSGTLLAYGIDSQGNFSPSVVFDAGDLLDARADERIIVSLKGNGTKIAFQYSALDSTQQSYMSASTTATGQQVMDYLRGDRSNETASPPLLRERGSRLGDIIHSRPFYVDDATLASGVAKTSTAPLPTVFVGSNDGMLHAFDATMATSTAGQERWSYVPSMLMPKMQALSKLGGYTHDYYVDGAINVGYIAAGAQRILVGALGAGGKGLYAIDISGDAGLAPADEATAASHILWEITDGTRKNAGTLTTGSDYDKLGYTYSNPVLAKVGGVDAVIVGNGYLGADGRAYLYIIRAGDGSLIRRIDTDSLGGNGLSTPVAVDSNGDGSVDTVYAGDLLGRLWKFNLSTNSASVLFDTARTPAQPITMTPGVAIHPNGGYMVTFATGSMLTAADSTDATTVYAAYGVWDGAGTYNTAMLTQALATRCFAYTDSTNTSCAQWVRVVSSPQTPDWSAGTSASPHTRGWITPLPAGERVVGDTSFIENARFYFNAYNPTVATTPVSGAQAVYGSNYLMELDYLSGGVAKNQPFLDLSGDVKLSNADRLVWRTGDPATSPATTNGNPILTADGVPVGKFISIGLMSQPILVQLTSLNDTLFNQNPDVTIPAVVVDRGVAGGHFDVDNYYNSSGKNAQAWTSCTGTDCDYQTHIHEYDDIYDVTGVNFLDTSSQSHDLSKAIASTSTAFKVLVQNQYLSPATKIHIGDASSYVFDRDLGYTAIKNYQTAPGITAETLLSTYAPTFTRATIGSFAVNMPVNAFEQRDWWGGVNSLPADVRVGLHPTYPSCVYTAQGKGDGNMYRPVIPPATVTTTGNGTKGYSSAKSVADNSGASGVRHNGALTFQLIRAETPASALELVVTNHPEYGWTLKRDQFKDYALTEYNIYWHYNKGIDEQCFGDARWTKLAIKDVRPCGSTDSASQKKCAVNKSAANGTDPHIGDLGSGSGGTAGTPVVVDTPNGTRTTITYTDGYVVTIVRTTNSQTGTTTITTTDSTGSIHTTETVVSTDGANKSGGDERGMQARTGRISWRELIQP
jgi:Tfp pilus tip-associated adhesin PilY1